MRDYKIIINDPDGNLVVTQSSIAGTGATYTSYANNASLAGALNVELDIPIGPYGTPLGRAYVKIWGISLGEIAQSSQLNPDFFNKRFFTIAVYGGMKPGLPLATAAAVSKQWGLLTEGIIFQAFGNWIGTDQTLDIVLYPDIGTNANPKNLPFTWAKGTKLSDALAVTLQTAFPQYVQNIQISNKLVAPGDQVGYYNTLEQLAAYVKKVSANIIGGNYTGVDIIIRNGTISVYDGSTQDTPIAIAFQDLIGQPTWIDGLNMQFKTVMRADIGIGSYVTMPKALVTTTQAAASSLANLKSAFSGMFRVNEIRHVGNFRQPDAASWISTFNAFPLDVKAAS